MAGVSGEQSKNSQKIGNLLKSVRANISGLKECIIKADRRSRKYKI